MVGLAENIHEAGLRRLAGESLLDNLVSPSVPDGNLESGVVSKSVGVILGRVPLGHAVEPFTHQFTQCVANLVWISRVVEFVRERLDEAESMIRFSQQEHPTIRSDAFVLRLYLDGTIKRRLK